MRLPVDRRRREAAGSADGRQEAASPARARPPPPPPPPPAPLHPHVHAQLLSADRRLIAVNESDCPLEINTHRMLMPTLVASTMTGAA
ncbi:hypothetical protein chiPu_0004759 [Chiloscyllium punctatum]|uniref:Uncharacterized protein n=1 Tax=Chiloscyllium punctatum TaxID=137246 RepID=A0A401S7G9_CHIPU|nr:hypothetical protein [Chiloscyllium punctatum]